ncbi:MAG: sensor histidine kinase [Poseidonibacter sp.]
MNLKNESKLLFIIRYALPFFILIIAILATLFLYSQNKTDFENIKENIEEKFIYNKKLIIKEQIETVYAQILSKQETTEKNLKKSLKNRVYEAHSIILSIYNKYKNTHTKDEIREIINAVIKAIKFNDDRGYFFIYDKKATNIIHPLLPHFEGKNLINLQDSKGVFVLKESLDLLKDDDESFQEWHFKKDIKDSLDYKKIGFIKNIYELDWFIGTGEYIEDFSQKVKADVLEEFNLRQFSNINKYFIIVDENNKYIKHKNPNLLGKSVSEIAKMYNVNIDVKNARAVSQKGGYITIKFPKPNSQTPRLKIVYSKSIPKWNWMVSTGFYIDDVQVLVNEEKAKFTQEYENNLESIYWLSFVVTSCLLLISFLISKLIKKRFKEYKLSIKNHTKENQKQYELLSQKSKLAAMGEMIGNIAHQWRQPLSVITTASSGIKIQKETNMLTDKILFDSLNIITFTAEHLSNTIEDFKDYFKPDKEKTIFSLEIPIKKTFKLLLSQANTKNVIFIKNIQEVKIEGYERELLQVLLNILNNALDAFSEDLSYKYVFINVYKKNNNAIIEIKDNAGGIKKSVLKRIFEPYFTTKHKSQGTGLGLYISQEIVSRHMDGIIEVENTTFTYNDNKYQGVQFNIVLPLLKDK